jgi:hypothetical protein
MRSADELFKPLTMSSTPWRAGMLTDLAPNPIIWANFPEWVCGEMSRSMTEGSVRGPDRD